MLFLSIPFGRLFCAYLCPAGGMEECAFAINDKVPKQGWRNWIKYVIWAVGIMAVAACYIYHGEITAVDFTYETNHGISISALPTYVIYYGIVLLFFFTLYSRWKESVLPLFLLDGTIYDHWN